MDSINQTRDAPVVDEPAPDPRERRLAWVQRVHRWNVGYRKVEVVIGAALIGWLGSCMLR